jgi:hypothetical protein
MPEQISPFAEIMQPYIERLGRSFRYSNKTIADALKLVERNEFYLLGKARDLAAVWALQISGLANYEHRTEDELVRKIGYSRGDRLRSITKRVLSETHAKGDISEYLHILGFKRVKKTRDYRYQEALRKAGNRARELFFYEQTNNEVKDLIQA